MVGIVNMIMAGTSFAGEVIGINKINKGYSSDDKYIIHLKSKDKLLLRLASIGEFERKKQESIILQEVQKYGVQSPRVHALGRDEERQLCFLLVSFLEGEDASDVLPGCTQKEQYTIGYQAGQDLRSMHNYTAPGEIEPWSSRMQKKYNDYCLKYKECGVRLKGEKEIAKYIEEHISLMHNRPNCFQHDDFHTGNIVINNRQYAGAIDFNRFDWGDPFHEFYKIALFSSEVSIPFSIGQIHGYFNKEVPDNFWPLYALYVAMAFFPAVVWTLKVVPEQLPQMIARLERILNDHRNFAQQQPIWYENIM